MVKLVGYRTFTSKKGNPCCIANIVSDFTSSDNDRGSYGSDVQSVFLPDSQVGNLSPKDIGKEVKLSYNIVNGRAFLNDFTVL